MSQPSGPTVERTNTAAVLYGIRDIRLEDRPVPEPGPREVLVEVRAVGVCGSDVHWYEHGRIGTRVVTGPLVLGHETMGVIVGVGYEVDERRIGERVAVEPGVPCGSCEQCRAGRYNLCAEIRFHGTPPIDGSFQRYIAIAADFVHPLPSSVSDEAGALIEALAVAVWASRKATIQPGASVLITGAGPIGLLCLQVAVAAGAAEAAISDINPDRLEVAGRLGATRLVDASTERLADTGVRADVLIECSGQPRAITDGIEALAPAGVAVMVGMSPGSEIPVPMATIQTREIRLTGVFRYANVFPTAIALAASGRVELDSLVTDRFPLSSVADALEVAGKKPRTIKPLVEPGRS
jgi:L-iditol 2-dehydrogenase